MAEFTLAGLRVVLETARSGSFSAAAERLGYTQSAVSRQIALMERAAGRALFDRGPRGTTVTEAGQVLVRRAEAVLGELGAARQELRDLDAGPAGRVRIGAFSTAMAALVPHAMRSLGGRATVVLREGLTPALLAAVARRRLDLAVVTPPGQAVSGLEMAPLLDDALFVATADTHPLAERASVPADALRDEAWIAGSAEPDSTLLGAWSDAQWRPRVAYVVRDWVAKLGLVAAGLGVTIVPGLAVPSLPPSLAVVRIDHPRAVRTTALAYRSGAPAERACAHLMEALRDSAAELNAQVRQRLARH